VVPWFLSSLIGCGWGGNIVGGETIVAAGNREFLVDLSHRRLSRKAKSLLATPFGSVREPQAIVDKDRAYARRPRELPGIQRRRPLRQRIRLRRIDTGQKETWESTAELRIGRLATSEISLDEASLSRQHARLFATSHGWRLSDLKSTNGTFLNGQRIAGADWPVGVHDTIRCGNISFVVESLESVPEELTTTALTPRVDDRSVTLPTTDSLFVQASAPASWESALQGFAADGTQTTRPGAQLVALLRAGHHLGHIEDEKELLHSILRDAVSALDAQRGAIVLAEGPENALHLKALATGRREPAGRTAFSQSLAQLAFSRDESILCQHVDSHPELAMAQSIADGAMASALCVLLRTPRRRLGVLHLDRGPLQKAFTKDDLSLADALAASVSAGIESAQLFQQQRDLFLNTITILAQAVELRDDYTGGHTARVTKYSELLARQMDLSHTDLKWISFGTPLHDIGKIGIDDAILRKPDGLTPQEFEIMKTHTLKGAAILSTIPDLAPVIPIVRSHHERWDGRGYPDRLAGEDIPRLARIVAVADTFDAMTSDRPYRKAMAADIALSEIKKHSGKQFDPDCATAFVEIREQVVKVMQGDPMRITAVQPGNAPASRSA
jgi:HD-GYP domain-containing protein (c-di-GMP phosphodiesterase class II)/pSer/pThr/pTyr-binding forkhead associated (FHA) protein